MAPTFKHGKNARIGLGTSGAPTTLVDVSTAINEVGMPRSADQVETTTLGATDKTFIPGFKDNTINLSGRYSGGTNEIDDQLSALFTNDVLVNFAYWPVGFPTAIGGAASAAQPKFTGQGYITGYDITSGVGDAVNFTATLMVVGAVTRGTS